MKQFILVAIIATVLFSCKSGKEINGSKRESLLVTKSWKMDAITQVENNKLISYTRGGTSNTNNYDDDVLRFKADGTGEYAPRIQDHFPIKWKFTNEQKTEMTIEINFGPTMLITLICTDVKVTAEQFFCVARFKNASSQWVLARVSRLANSESVDN